MTDERRKEFSPQQKAADMAARLWEGHEVTTREVAQIYGMTWHGAHRLMSVMSGAIPITTNSTGVWRRFDIG